MSLAAPETTFNDISRRVYRMLRGTVSPNDFDLKRLDHDIAQLKRVDASGALEMEGVISGMRGDVAGLRRKYELAFNAGGGVDAAMRLVSTLEHLNEGDEVLRTIERFKAEIRSDPKHSRFVHDVLGRLGYLAKAQALAKDVERMGLELSNESELVVAMLEKHRFTEEEIREPISFVKKHLAASGTRVLYHRSSWPMIQGDDLPLFYEFVVDGEPDKVAQEQLSIFEELAKHDFRAEREGFLVLALAMPPDDLEIVD